MKKFLLMACIAISMLGFSAYAVDTWDGTADTDWSKDANGNYLIYTAEELAGLAQKVNGGEAYSGKTFLLMDDLDLNNRNWNPIGYLEKQYGANTTTDEKYFSGIFDGQGHYITQCKVYLDECNSGWIWEDNNKGRITAGLFGAISGAKIRNLCVKNSNFFAKGNVYDVMAGAIVAWSINNSEISNCSSIENNIEAKSTFKNIGNADAGGICGSSQSSTVTSCTVIGNTLTSTHDSDHIGEGYGSDDTNNIKDNNTTNATTKPEDALKNIAETNRANLISNSWGNPATAHKYIDETTGMTTDIVYYAFEGVSNSMAGDGYRSDATISYDGAKGAKIDNFEYNGKTYTLYPQGAKLNVTFNLKGWSADEKNTGWKVTQVYDSNASYPAQLNPVLKSDTKSAAVNAATGRYDRAEVYEITVPAQKFGILYETKNNSDEWAATNLNTFIWNNDLAQGSINEPASPNYINETTGEVTNHIYYAVEVDNTKATDGSVENVTIAGANERVFVVNGKEYTAYPQDTQLTATFTLNGWVKDENSGYFVKAIDGIEAQRTALSVDENNAKRTEVYSMVVPGKYTTMSYTTHNPSDINRATILYNNFGEGKKPTSPYYIDETTGIATDLVYYTVAVDDTKATEGSVRAAATISGDNALAFEHNDKTYTLYPAGTELTATFSLNGWSKDEKNTGYFVKAVEGVEAQIIPAEDTKGELQEDRYLRTEAYKFTMPAQLTTVTYTTHNKSDEWAATNKENFISNSWGNTATAHKYIDETTGTTTELVYYAFDGISDADAEGVTAAATISYEGEDAKTIQYNNNTYTLYPAGAKLTATFNLQGWSENEKNTGWSVSEVYGSNDAVLSYDKISDTKSDDVNAETGRYDRTEVYEITVPAHKFDILYKTTNNSNEWAAINRATILYNNFGEGTEPESSNYINETTGEETNFIYYTIEINDAKATEGSVRAAATISGDNALAFEHNEKSYTLYPAGTELTATFSLNGWSENEKNTGYFVKAVEGVEAQIIPAEDTKGELKEGRYLRTEAYKFTMPAQATTVAYTTHNKSNEWAATNRATILYNNFGEGTKPESPYYINETTGIATNLVYYAFEGISDADAEGVTEAATISYEGEDAKTIQYNDNTYTLYPAGAKLTATFNLQGWSEDEKNTGWSVSEVYGSNDVVLSYDKISDTKSAAVNGATGRYDRAEVYEITVPAHKFDILYKTTNNSDEWAAINRATILYNNFGEGTEPESPYYIDETTGEKTDYIYYMYEGITDELAFIGSVRQGATVEHSEYKLDFVKDDTIYTMYPADHPSVTATFYLEGFTGDWSNVGYYIESITNQNTDEIVEAGLVEIYDDYETHNEFTNRFMRKCEYKITMPESPLALAYTTIMEQPTDVEDVTAEALQVYGVEGALVVKATAPAQLVVVTVDGRVAYSGMVEGNIRIALPAGMYIANNHKVIVR